MSNTPQLSAASVLKLQRISQNLTAVLFEANRDPVNGTFKAGSSVSAPALRKAWGIAPSNSSRELFKKSLLAALRSRK